MNRLKDLWGGQDAVNRIAFIAAIAAFIWCIIEGHGLYGVVFAVVILFLIISRSRMWTASICRIKNTCGECITLHRINQNVPLHEFLYLHCGHLINLLRCFCLLELSVHIKKKLCTIGVPCR